MRQKFNFVDVLKEKRKVADFAFYRAIELKDQFLIASAVGRLNEIDWQLLREEYREKQERWQKLELEAALMGQPRKANHEQILRKRAKQELAERMVVLKKKE